MAIRTLGTLLLTLACTGTASAQAAADNAASLVTELQRVRGTRGQLDLHLEASLRANSERITTLREDLNQLRRERVPRQAIEQAQATLRAEEARTLELIHAHAQRRARLDRREARLTNVFEPLPNAGQAGQDPRRGPRERNRAAPEPPRALASPRRPGLSDRLRAALGEGPEVLRRVDASAPTTASVSAKRQLANALTSAGGTATDVDRALVVDELMKLPPSILERLAAQHTEIIVGRGSVADVRTDLKGVRPRGWPPGSSWDDVMGLYQRNQVVVATAGDADARRIAQRGSSNYVLHEIGHALDRPYQPGALPAGGGRPSRSAAFIEARSGDASRLWPYLKQPGEAGLSETYAEGLGRYLGEDPTLRTEWPSLYTYFEEMFGSAR